MRYSRAKFWGRFCKTLGLGKKKGLVRIGLTQLFNNCTDQNIFPENFKLAIVTPILKTSSPKSMKDFRPISLLPIFSKIFEKIIAERMMSFIDKNSILTSSQFRFRTSSSTELAVTSIYDELLQHLDDNKPDMLHFFRPTENIRLSWSQYFVEKTKLLWISW